MHKRFMIHEEPYNIPCLLYSGGGSAFDWIVLCCHGFAGHKGNGAMKRFADYILDKHESLAVLCFDWPCHGKDTREKLRLEDCLTYLDLVIRYAKTELAAKDLYLYATSFGGYLTLLYIAEHGNPFQKLALRCPAVNMYEVLASGIMTEEDKMLLSEGKSVLIGFDRKIAVDSDFLASLQAADISKLDYVEYSGDILILHGIEDEIVPVESVEDFAEDNYIDYVTIHADHRFTDPAEMMEAIWIIDTLLF